MSISKKLTITLCAGALSLYANTAFSAPCSVGGYANSFSNGSDFSINWDVCTGDVLMMEISNASTGWIGVGFSIDESMANTDVFLGGVDETGGYGYDGFSSDYSAPTPDTLQDFSLLSATEISGVTTLELSRALNTGDISDYDLSADSFYLLWAYGSTDDYSIHAGRGASALAYSFNSSPIPIPATLPLMLSGLSLLGVMCNRKRHKKLLIIN